MSRFPDILAIAGLIAIVATPGVAAQQDEIGSPATPEEVAAWNKDVRPDGLGLPPGQGSAADGESLYGERCAQCHGDFGEGLDRYPALIGGRSTLATGNPVRTVGSYWPYATTLWDYIYRTMPFGDAQSLSFPETYAVTAYVLYLNDLVDADRTLDRTTLPLIEMPNRGGFVDAPMTTTRPSAGEPCMTACKDRVEITGQAPPLREALGQ